MQDLGIDAKERQNDATIAIVVDGAKVLICFVANLLQQNKEMTHLQAIYCGAYRVECIDHFVISVPKTDQWDPDAQFFKGDQSSKFVSRSTKWQAPCYVPSNAAKMESKPYNCRMTLK